MRNHFGIMFTLFAAVSISACDNNNTSNNGSSSGSITRSSTASPDTPSDSTNSNQTASSAPEATTAPAATGNFVMEFTAQLNSQVIASNRVIKSEVGQQTEIMLKQQQAQFNQAGSAAEVCSALSQRIEALEDPNNYYKKTTYSIRKLKARKQIESMCERWIR